MGVGENHDLGFLTLASTNTGRGQASTNMIDIIIFIENVDGQKEVSEGSEKEKRKEQKLHLRSILKL